jgi:hypothetical protein
MLDVRLSQPRLLRRGALSVQAINDVVQPLGCTVVEDDDPDDDPDDGSNDGPDDDSSDGPNDEAE